MTNHFYAILVILEVGVADGLQSMYAAETG
jgi:hypothetical protein